MCGYVLYVPKIAPKMMLVLTGPPGSGKTERLLEEYARVLSSAEPGAVLWLAPTWRAAADVRRRLVSRLSGCFSPGITTFTRFARWIVDSMPQMIRPIDALMKRELVRRIIRRMQQQGQIEYFLPIVDKPGLLSLICDFIAELKRYEIWPADLAKACRLAGQTAKDRELHAIYAAYQATLLEHNLYDEEGLLWSARDWLGRVAAQLAGETAAGQPAAAANPVWQTLKRLKLVVADGFADFTRTQHEILEILARCAQQVYVSLILESEAGRSELFAKPLKTLAELRRRHKDVVVEQLQRPMPARWPALDHVERWLFGNPRTVPARPDAEGIEILAAARPMGELEQIGARIKLLLAQGGVCADQIAVVFRTLDGVHVLVREVFGKLGIPFAVDYWPALGSCPALRALVALLRLELDDWSWQRLLAVLANSYFQPGWMPWHPPEAAAVDSALRQLGVLKGKRRWLEALSASAAATGAGQQVEPSLHGVRLAAQVLTGLAEALEELPRKATLSGWANAWEKLARRTGLLATAVKPLPDDAIPLVTDGEGWQQLCQVLRDSDRWGQLLGEAPPELELGQAVEVLEDILSNQAASGVGEEAGRVRVLTAKSVRSLRIPYLFVAGLAEKAFPLKQSESRLYGDADRDRLIEHGLPLVGRVEHTCEEMLLFYEVVTRATRYLCLSYPALDEQGEPLSPSPYLKDLERLFAPKRIRRVELTDLRPVGDAQNPPLSAEQFRLKAVQQALQNEPKLLRRLVAAARADEKIGKACGVVWNILEGLRIIDMRQQDGFTAAEGLLHSEPALAWLSSRFHLRKTYSVSELEEYAYCPFRYFATEVLGVEPLEELEAVTDVVQRGLIAHELLAALHKALNQKMGCPSSPAELEPDRYLELLQEVFAQAFPPKPTEALKAALWEIDRCVVRRWLEDYYQQCVEYDKQQQQHCGEPLRPAWFEVSFGRGECHQELPSHEPFTVQDGQVGIRVSGRIDRIDLGIAAGRVVFNVIDYKTGSASKPSLEDVQSGVSLQLPVYVMAANDLLNSRHNAYPFFAGYWILKDKGFKVGNALQLYDAFDGKLQVTKEWSLMREEVGKTVVRLVNGMRRGLFYVYSQDDACTQACWLKTVCRIGQIRSLEKQPPL